MQLETVFNTNITNAKGAVNLETAALRGVPHHVLSKVRHSVTLHYELYHYVHCALVPCCIELSSYT
jgi:hypothetical protein